MASASAGPSPLLALPALAILLAPFGGLGLPALLTLVLSGGAA